MAKQTRRPQVVEPVGAQLDVHATLKNMGRMVAKHAGGEKIWHNGLGDVVGAMVDECGLPKSVSALDAARALGLVKPNRRRRS